MADTDEPTEGLIDVPPPPSDPRNIKFGDDDERSEAQKAVDLESGASEEAAKMAQEKATEEAKSLAEAANDARAEDVAPVTPQAPKSSSKDSK